MEVCTWHPFATHLHSLQKRSAVMNMGITHLGDAGCRVQTNVSCQKKMVSPECQFLAGAQQSKETDVSSTRRQE